MNEAEAMQAAILDLLQRVQRLEAEAADRRFARAIAMKNTKPGSEARQ